MINWICGVTGVQKKSGKMPVGWFIPATDISTDEPKEVLPRGTVVAISSKKALSAYLKEHPELIKNIKT